MKSLIAIAAFLLTCYSVSAQQTRRVLVFSKVNRYYHESIPAGMQAMQRIGNALQVSTDTTSDAKYFTEDSLKHYDAVVFLSTSGDSLLDPSQKADFQRYIEAGGGFMGIHCAAATEYSWPFYGQLVGAVFDGHPEPQPATILVKDRKHPSTRHLPKKWKRFDEWYNFRNIQNDLQVLLTLDEKTYEGGTNGNDHPIAWYHEFSGGRSFYTAPGHTSESFSEPHFVKHLSEGLQYAMGNGVRDYSKAKTRRIPAVNGRLLIFSRTKGFRHNSIPQGIAAVQKIAQQKNYEVAATEDPSRFTDDTLKKYHAVIFLSTTGNILNATQQAAFERYIQAGGGFVGVHSAADTEYDWPWYNNLVGAYFESHPNNPNVRKAIIDVTDTSHVSTNMLPARWERTDEWYNYKSIYSGIRVLASLDENTYEGGTNGKNHPIAWYHEYDGGRAFYTGSGHTEESYSEPLFLAHLAGGIDYALGSKKPLDYSKAYAEVMPDQNRFVKTTLTEGLASPMELAVAPDGKVFFTELLGKLSMYDPVTKKTSLIHQFPITNMGGTGLIGVTLDPSFQTNRRIYLYYAPGGSTEDNLHFVLSRFTLKNNNRLDLSSEIRMLKVPVEKNSGSHHGGSLAWDKHGNLFLSTGDGTSPFPSDGYAPLDEREGKEYYSLDAQRSAANTNDLKGKILRIHPEDDGTYTIPAGNLFPVGMAKTRPEIYAMGARNPYRIAVNPETSTVYWGDIGPDAGEDSERGPRGYDEFNQARKPGNFGWPYFVGENFAYPRWDFVKNTPGEKYDPAKPVNFSRNNTGLNELPPAQPPMIAYPYVASAKFPELGLGGRCAIAGDFYRYDPAASSPNKFPEYYNGMLFIADWMRNWVFSVRFDENENYLRNEPFMSSKGDFRRPIDMAFGTDGLLYMLEYGSVYGADNDDSRLVRIEYFTGNRAPLAKAAIVDTVIVDSFSRSRFLTGETSQYPVIRETAGQPPLTVSFGSRGSVDLDDDDTLSFAWYFDGKTKSAASRNATYTYSKPGVYHVLLKVTDRQGLSATDTLTVKVGNTAPLVKIESPDNTSFGKDNKTFTYSVKVQDREDGKPDPNRIKAFYFYNPQPVKNNDGILSASFTETEYPGKTIMASSDCKSCHLTSKKAVGPSYVAIANRYKKQPGAIDRLAEKIIAGGGGSWGTQYVMSAHPQLSTKQAKDIVSYIFSLTDKKKKETPIPASGQLKLSFNENEPAGQYTIVANYTDKGNAATGPLKGTDVITIRNYAVKTVYADAHPGFARFGNNLSDGGHKAYILLRNVDLNGIRRLSFLYSAEESHGMLEVRLDSRAGPVVSSVPFEATGKTKEGKVISAEWTQPVSGRHDVYVFVTRRNKPYDEEINLKEIRFEE